jgi:cytoskeletal protein RodZ
MAAIPRKRFMLLILLEALLALVLLVGIVWWTMFSGRKKGEPPGRDDAPPRG